MNQSNLHDAEWKRHINGSESHLPSLMVVMFHTCTWIMALHQNCKVAINLCFVSICFGYHGNRAENGMPDPCWNH